MSVLVLVTKLSVYKNPKSTRLYIIKPRKSGGEFNLNEVL